ncbi:autophagy-related protein 11 [Colletotrichum sp. SAR11_240]|nr:autophagy-related protein 11 [Colletotrichum sp. SAR11_240]
MHNQYANTAGDTSQEAKNQHDESHVYDALLRQVRDLKSKLKAEKEKSAKLKKMLSTRTAEYNEITDKKGDKGEEDIEVILKHGRGRPRKRSEAEPSSAPRRKRQRPRKLLD